MPLALRAGEYDKTMQSHVYASEYGENESERKKSVVSSDDVARL